MGNFRPSTGGPSARFQNMGSLSSFLREYRQHTPLHNVSSTPPIDPERLNFNPADHGPPLQAQSEPESDTEMQEPRESSPDPLDLFNDALIAESLLHFAEQDVHMSLEEALEFAFAAKANSRLPSEPAQWRDIAGRPDAHLWHAAALEEFNALLDNGTFEPVRLPAGRKAIGCRWVFKLKRKPDGSIDRHKARLVAKGFSQRPGLDFGQVFASTARWAALRAVFALAAIQDLELFSLDISNAFLNGEMDHEVFM